MNTLIAALDSALPEGLATEIVFIPEGSHRITPQSHPKGIVVHLPPEKGASVAARLQEILEKRLQENVKPWFDFEHTRKFPASGYPTAFRYEAGRGVIATVEWSSSGRNAIDGRDVRYFSPEFYIDKEGVPNGVPERGPLGGLVTEPAFREIPAIAASSGPSSGATDFLSASERVLEQGLASCITDAYSIVANDRPDLYASYCAGITAAESAPEVKSFDDPLGELESRAEKLVRTRQAENLDNAMGSVAASDPALYDDYCLSLHDGRAEANSKRIAASYLDPMQEIEKRAGALVSCGLVVSFDEGIVKACEQNPDLYSAYLETLIG